MDDIDVVGRVAPRALDRLEHFIGDQELVAENSRGIVQVLFNGGEGNIQFQGAVEEHGRVGGAAGARAVASIHPRVKGKREGVGKVVGLGVVGHVVPVGVTRVDLARRGNVVVVFEEGVKLAAVGCKEAFD